MQIAKSQQRVKNNINNSDSLLKIIGILSVVCIISPHFREFYDFLRDNKFFTTIALTISLLVLYIKYISMINSKIDYLITSLTKRIL